MRYNNISMFQDTMRILESGRYFLGNEVKNLKLTTSQMEAAEVYLPARVREITTRKDFDHTPVPGRCEYGCENIDSFSLARKRMKDHFQAMREEGAKPVLVLNLANPVHPGGGVRNGARAQEEDLCRKSSLLRSLESRNAEAYYWYNRSLDTYMGSDAVIINPYVEIIKDENGELLKDSVVISVLTCAAPMIKRGLEGMSQAEYERMVYYRIEGMLKVAAFLGYKDLILGAFGCGAFGNDARVVSDLFYRVLREFDYDGMKESDMFRSIMFAVLDHSEEQYNYREFCRNFADFYRDGD